MTLILRRLRPAPRLLYLLAGLAVVGILIAALDYAGSDLAANGATALRWMLVTLIFIALADAWVSRRPPLLAVQRLLPGSLALGQWTPVRLRLQLEEEGLRPCAFFDHYPAGCEVEGMPVQLLADGRAMEAHYRVRPQQRGLARFAGLELRIGSWVRLWEVQFWLPLEDQVKVYPNFSAIAGYSLLAVDNHTSQMGVRKRPRRGEGTEFHQLREYRDGDSLRQVDWKATSRRLQLISREFQEERDQQVLLMLDCGRRMRAQDGELSHFDHALNAALMLAFVALRQGDAVGMMSFGQSQRWIPATKSSSNINHLLNAFYDLYPGPHASDYLSASRELVTRQRKRSLVVLLTNLRDEDRDDLLRAVKLMRQHHLVLVANLREDILDASLQQPVTDMESALRYSGTNLFLRERQALQERLQTEGVLIIDCSPRQLNVRLINRYLEIKRSGML